MPSPAQLAVLVGLLIAIASPALQAGLGIGLSAQEFAGQGDSTLRAEGYAFSIWSVIYLTLIAFAIWQALPAQRNDPHLTQVRAPAAMALAGIGLWIWASSFDLRWTSVAIIVGSAWMAIRALGHGRGPWTDWPLGLLAGWLTIASALNILTVATADGLIGPANALPAAISGIAVVAVVALLVFRRLGRIAYPLPIIWGLLAVWVAERSDQPGAAIAAVIAASLLTAVVASTIVHTAFGYWRKTNTKRP
jgi:hypothetical protein